jgi:nucleotide-binding universal stress UspA family protein
MMRILVPLDGAAFSELAVKPAVALAEHLATPSHVLLLSVLTTPEIIGGEYGALMHERLGYLERIKETLALPEEYIETMVRCGDPTKMICSAGWDEMADIILMTGHHQKGYGNVAHSCTADAVIKRSSVPAIVLSPDEESLANPTSFMIRVSQAGPFQSALVSECAAFLAQMYTRSPNTSHIAV